MPLDTAMTPELGVTDFKKSLDFYINVLGFTVQYDWPEEGFAMLERQGSRIMIDEFREGKNLWAAGPLEYPLGCGMNLKIYTLDAAGLYERAKSSGARIFLELEEKWYRIDAATESGNRQFIILDPDGYMLRFAEDMGDRPLK